MGRPKKELKKIHKRKIKKAKKQARLYAKKEFPFEKLTQLAKNFVRKSKQKKKTL